MNPIFIALAYIAAAFFLTILIGFVSAGIFRFVAFDRLFRAPRYWVLRKLGAWRRKRKSNVASMTIYWIGCPDCFPTAPSLAFWGLVWFKSSRVGFYFPLPALVVPALAIGSRVVARWVLRQLGWSGTTVIKDGVQVVQGVRDFPPEVAHAMTIEAAMKAELKVSASLAEAA